MTPEELMKPRWKVIAGFPNSPFAIGQVFTIPNFDKEFTKKYWTEEKDRYPHLFQRLEWFEERQGDEPPQYIKSKNVIYKADRWSRSFQGIDWLGCFVNKTKYISCEDLTPVTLDDYTAYINQQH